MNSTAPARRVSKSLLDPWFAGAVPSLYARLAPPRRLPPEAIVAVGHGIALVGAVGFALSAVSPWAGVVAALGVAGNHLADMLDGTHARRTGQCRHGGELLDHFTDPLSFSAWVTGIAVSCGRIELGLLGVIGIYATALLTNIRAKITGEFRLHRVGPTEFKALLVVYGFSMAGLAMWAPAACAPTALGFLAVLVGGGLIGLAIDLACSVRQVNAHESTVDSTEWEMGTGRH